jgi:hypothetical protein
MSSGTTAVIIIAIIVIVAVIVAVAVSTRRRRLQRQFGPEYDRAVSEQGKLRAESELADRQRRVRKLAIKPLSDEAKRRYSADWAVIQEQFVDAPEPAVGQAYELVTTVMTERGYPIEDEEQVVADLSVEHAETVSNFRSAREIAGTAAAGNASTEDLRQAMIHYRSLFSDLLGEPTTDAAPAAAETGRTQTGRTETIGPGTVSPERTDAEPVAAEPAVAEPMYAEPADAEPADAVLPAAGPIEPVSSATVDAETDTPEPVEPAAIYPDGEVVPPAERTQPADSSQR